MYSNLSLNTIVVIFILNDAELKGINQLDTMEVIANAINNDLDILKSYREAFY